MSKSYVIDNSDHIICTNIAYDGETDFWWAWFRYSDDEGPEVQFRLPVNPNDFEVGGLYRMRFTKIEEL